MKALAGQTVFVEYALLDLNLDGVATQLEMDYVEALLRDAGVKTRRMFFLSDLLAVDGLAKPAKSSKMIIVGRPLDDFGDRKQELDALRKHAMANGIEVVEAVDVMERLGVKAPDADELRAFARRALKERLKLKVPEVPLTDVSFHDALDFLRDLTRADIRLDAVALKAAGLSETKQLYLRVYNVPAAVVVELITLQAFNDAAVVRTDGEQLVVTTRAAAERDDRLRPIDSLLDQEITQARKQNVTTDHLKKQLDRALPEVALNGSTIDAIEFVRDAAQVNIMIDREGVAAANVNLKGDIKVNLKDKPARSVILAIVTAASPKLAVYVHRGDVLRVTTAERAAAAVKAFPGSVLLTE